MIRVARPRCIACRTCEPVKALGMISGSPSASGVSVPMTSG